MGVTYPNNKKVMDCWRGGGGGIYPDNKNDDWVGGGGGGRDLKPCGGLP